MSNEVIKHIRQNMKPDEKTKLTTKLLKGYTGDGWAIEVLTAVYGEYDHGKLPSIKQSVFDLLASKFESEQ